LNQNLKIKVQRIARVQAAIFDCLTEYLFTKWSCEGQVNYIIIMIQCVKLMDPIRRDN